MVDDWGIDDGYWDVGGTWHDVDPTTRRALRMAMGGLADVADPPPRSRPVWFVRHGTTPAIHRPAELVLEDGSRVAAAGVLPPDLPLGYHDLHPDDGGPVTRLIVVPERCPPPDRRVWGWAVQLYAARSASSWGLGDLGDLRTLGRWSAGLGAGILATSPLGAPLPTDDPDPSPYFPSSRRYRNPLHIDVSAVPGFDDADVGLATAASAGRALNAERRLDRARVWKLKRGALERLYGGFRGDPRFDAYVAAAGDDLHRYATFAVLAEHHRSGWRDWPAEHRRPEGPGVARFAAARAARIRFHCWLQWLLDEQLAAAAAEVSLLGDLPVGVDPDGADAWLWQDVFASTVRVGAPPDEFNTEGQNWGIVPFVPWRLRAVGYEPWALTVRAALAGYGGLRIDHVMGLFRLWWIPEGCGPTGGGYVRFPETDLLDVVALEAVRAGSVIVGEDLGTVEDEVRSHLRDRSVLSYEVVWFEESPPSSYPPESLAAVTTHDLPTVAGVWTGADPRDAEEHRDRIVSLTGVAAGSPVDEVVVALHETLAEAPSAIVTATLDDALGACERPNLPGSTADEYPSWRIALPVPLEELFEDPLAQGIARALAASARPGR